VALTQFLVSARFVNDPKALTEQLRKFKGQSVILRSYMGDAEGWGLCTALLYIAHSAEMNTTDECSRGYPDVPPLTTIVVSGPDIQETVSLGGIISSIGRFGSTSGVVSGIKAPTLTIFVGTKSPFTIRQAPAENPPAKKKSKNQAITPTTH
jgi:hypothetical protein